MDPEMLRRLLLAAVEGGLLVGPTAPANMAMTAAQGYRNRPAPPPVVQLPEVRITAQPQPIPAEQLTQAEATANVPPQGLGATGVPTRGAPGRPGFPYSYRLPPVVDPAEKREAMIQDAQAQLGLPTLPPTPNTPAANEALLRNLIFRLRGPAVDEVGPARKKTSPRP